MNIIDFYGCSFTESPKLPYTPPSDRFDLELYSMHCHVTKPISGFLEFDMAYNNQSNYEINNYGKGSFGNFTIHNVISNKVKKLNRFDNNIAIVQLSAILRNEHSWECIQEKERYEKDDKDVFNIDFAKVKPDYIVQSETMDDYYNLHIQNFKNIINLLKENYDRYIIFFGWDITTKEFRKIFLNSELKEEILYWNYEYPLTSTQYFENDVYYVPAFKKYKGTTGGMLDYSANKLPQNIRYVSDRDHHPSYFSNKVFYEEIVKPFISSDISFKKSYFEEDNVKIFEQFLEQLLKNKLNGEKWENYSYSELQMESIGYVRKQILNK